MPGTKVTFNYADGLREKDIPALHQQYGKNIFTAEKQNTFLNILRNMIKEPMFIMLIAACILYFILSQPNEGLLMLTAMFFVGTVSFYQEVKSSKALQALNQLTKPKSVVIRNGKEKPVAIEDLVPGDIIVVEEGNNVPADAVIMQSNDLSVNESILTGESLPVQKDAFHKKNLYQGTTINSGKCYAKITATGNNTELGKLGKAINTYAENKTLLQQQTGVFVKRLALFGVVAFILIFVINFLRDKNISTSLLYGLTIAMAAIPEEIPVAFSSFMALGAYQMTKAGIITRQPQTIENIGAITVICLDKTGTITENKMEVNDIYDVKTHAEWQPGEQFSPSSTVLYFATLASETKPFDAMEKAIGEAYTKYSSKKFLNHNIVYEYSLEGKPPMMTHLYKEADHFIVAAKGAPERIISICAPGKNELIKIQSKIKEYAAYGYRVIAIASAIHSGKFPTSQNDFNWKFEGLLSLYDPPKQGTEKVFLQFYNAGISIKLLTGDYAQTAINIARQVGIKNTSQSVNGDEVMLMNNDELKTAVYSVDVFARMFPEAKLRVIDALKQNGEIVAMTGDGVNDAPALKSANVGIAMGEKGTEIARQASNLILTDDNLVKVAEAIAHGRKIFINLRKAVRYIISIHIPIIIIASLPLLLNWKYPNIFTPIHIIFLELIMGPTCSIFFEREPAENNLMTLPPRNKALGLFTTKEVLLSVTQGLAITAGVLFLFYFFMQKGSSLEEVRTIVFTTLIMANILLTFSNRSFTETIFKTFLYKNNLAIIVIVVSIIFLAVILAVPEVTGLFKMSKISFGNIIICIVTALVCVEWFEIYKGFAKKHLLSKKS